MGSLAGFGVGERWVYSPRLKILERGITPPLRTFDSSRTPAPGERLAAPRTLAQLDVSAIAAALAPSADPESQIAGFPDDTIPADPVAAVEKGWAIGGMLVDRDSARSPPWRRFLPTRRRFNEALVADRDRLVGKLERIQRVVMGTSPPRRAGRPRPCKFAC